MLGPQKSVKCIDCGYLFRSEETRRPVAAVPSRFSGSPDTIYETSIQALEFTTRNELMRFAHKLACYRHASLTADLKSEDLKHREEIRALPPLTDPSDHDADWERRGRLSDESAARKGEVLRQERDCPFYFPYAAGYGPREHLELREKKADSEAAFRRGLVQTFVGGLIGIAGAAVVAVLKGS